MMGLLSLPNVQSWSLCDLSEAGILSSLLGSAACVLQA